MKFTRRLVLGLTSVCPQLSVFSWKHVLPSEVNELVWSTGTSKSIHLYLWTNECDHLTMSDEIKHFSTGLTNLRCLPFPVWGHWLPCLGNKTMSLTIYFTCAQILFTSHTYKSCSNRYSVQVAIMSLTCEDSGNALHHQLGIFHTKAHWRFELHNIFPRAICTDTDLILFQPGTKGYH